MVSPLPVSAGPDAAPVLLMAVSGTGSPNGLVGELRVALYRPSVFEGGRMLPK